jgi:hypothetical protein
MWFAWRPILLSHAPDAFAKLLEGDDDCINFPEQIDGPFRFFDHRRTGSPNSAETPVGMAVAMTTTATKFLLFISYIPLRVIAIL